jgi:beta-N-acetylhexosaminidase
MRSKLVLPFLACFVACALTARADEPKAKVHIRGEITLINVQKAKVKDNEVVRTSIRVEGKKEADTEYDKAVVRLSDQTKIMKRDGKELKEAKAADLAKGQKVEVTFIGPVAESYPVQANGSLVIIVVEKEEKK